jgi:hypothetical protein
MIHRIDSALSKAFRLRLDLGVPLSQIDVCIGRESYLLSPFSSMPCLLDRKSLQREESQSRTIITNDVYARTNYNAPLLFCERP